MPEDSGTHGFLKRGVQKAPARGAQRGSILIGIIVTMVVMALLGTGMLYLTTTSTLNELFFGSHSDAYYAAEAGGRYAKAVIRDAYATDKSKLGAINANQVFTLSNGSTFQIKNLQANGGSPETLSFVSIGTVSFGLMQSKRQIAYSIQPAKQNSGGGSSGPTGPIDFDHYSLTPVTGGGKVTVLEGGLGIDLNTASGGAGKAVTVLCNDAWTYTGDYAVQAKTHADISVGANKDWHMGLFVNMKKNGTNLPYGYGMTFFNAWSESQLTFASPLPESASGSPIVLVWKNDPAHGVNWIAYAPLNEDAMRLGIGRRIAGGWYLGLAFDLTLPTMMVKVTRNTGGPSSNDLRVYFAGPVLQGTADDNPVNYTRRRAYPKWTSLARAADEIKWPSVGSWPASNDYFTMLNSNNTSPSSPAPIAKWIKNTDPTVTATTTFETDTTTITGAPIPNAVIRSTLMTGADYSGVCLFIDPCGGSPHGDFFNLGIQSSGSGSGSDGSGTVIQYP